MDYRCLDGKKISIWGTEMKGRQAYIHLRTIANVHCFYDTYAKNWGKEFCGLPVKQWIPGKMEEEIIIISESWEMVPKLVHFGLKPFKDFIPYSFLLDRIDEYGELYQFMKLSKKESYSDYLNEKKLAINFGYCHSRFINHLLVLDEKFNSEYQVVNIPCVHWFRNRTEEEIELYNIFIEDEVLFQKVDLFIYETVKENDQKIPMNVLKKYLRDNCALLHFPLLNFSGYFPQLYKKRKDADTLSMYNVRYFDRFIDDLLIKGGNIDNICREVMSDDFLSKKEIEKWLKKQMILLKLSEKNCDIKIADFVENKFNKIQLFASPAHPTLHLLVEVSNRILDYLYPEYKHSLQEKIDLNHESRMFSAGFLTVGTDDCIIYPCVEKTLKLNKILKSFMICCDSGIRIPLSREEYIYEYARLRKYELNVDSI